MDNGRTDYWGLDDARTDYAVPEYFSYHCGLCEKGFGKSSPRYARDRPLPEYFYGFGVCPTCAEKIKAVDYGQQVAKLVREYLTGIIQPE